MQASLKKMKFNDKGISQKFKLVYSLQSNMKKKPITVLARFRRVGEIVAVDYKFKDLEKWFKAFEANEQLGHYLVFNQDRKLSIKTLFDYYIIKSIKIM